MEYRVVWSSSFGQGEKTVESAIMAQTWIAEFEDKGATAIVVYRDGQHIERSQLPGLVKSETEAYQIAKNAHRT